MSISGSTTTRPVPPAGPPTQLAAFRARCEDVAGVDLTSTTALHAFSVERSDDFWRTFLGWSGLVWEGAAEPVRTGDDVRHARFFPDVRLNYAENLLRPLPDADDDAPALTSVHGDGSVDRFTRGGLRTAVRRTAAALGDRGIGVGDRVVMIAPNHSATVVAGLALAALGATLSTATPDMGPSALLGRFGQVEPVALLLDRTGMARGDVPADDVLAEVLAGLPTVRQVLLLDDGLLPTSVAPGAVRLADLVASVPAEPRAGSWPRLPFDHPLWVMFSSGTTGPPKAMVHGAGGSLITHVKEHRLHNDLRPRDTLYFHTTTAWMMWNWQLSALAVGAHVVLYDGAVTGPETLWELVAAHGVTVFGTSPAYLQLCQDEGYRPRDAVDLSRVRAVLSTGAVLHEWQFAWVADAVGAMPLQSISGGTDIIGCFVLGHPEEPVQPGRCQSLSLGLDVAALDDEGRPVLGEVGELVCRRPFPSRPVGFLADPDGARFTESYFSQHPGMWTHGDQIEIAADGSARMHGRSDGLLNVNGVRIGPSEIYTIVRRLPEVAGAMAVEQRDPDAPGSTRLVLLVVLAPGARLDDPLRERIGALLRREGSPAHVPSLILGVSELPLTHNGKYSERAARDTLNGDPVRNLAALKNAPCLVEIAAAAEAAEADRASLPDLGDGDGDLTSVVRRAFADVLGHQVPDTADFFDVGGTSRQSMRLLRRLRLELDRPLRMTTFLAGPTVAGVAAAVAAGDEDDAPVELLRAGEADEPPLYLVHGNHGDVDIYRTTVGLLDLAAPVHGLTARLQTPSGARRSIVELAGQHVETIGSVQPDGPVRLAGFSFGGLVAFEMARQFTAMGRPVAFLGLLDVHPPARQLPPVSRVLNQAADRVSFLIPGMTRHTAREALAKRLRLAKRAPAGHARPDVQVPWSTRDVYNDYRWGTYAGPVTYFRASRRIPVFLDMLYEWRKLVPRMTVVDVPGAHSYLLDQEHAPVLAARLSEALRASDGPAVPAGD
ncbi:MAG: acetoacetyl-CoA synthase [Modestobacter sp.]|nr:acetoacetyl-CoA synthase [Modestobacter sp.]